MELIFGNPLVEQIKIFRRFKLRKRKRNARGQLYFKRWDCRSNTSSRIWWTYSFSENGFDEIYT